ncbi:MAG: alpha-methyl-L-serine aldolase [uncultured Solirubrobacteraceae bacterium]|uniref:Alpha-methyl-L-serine aldolase n=1 Tax=uncultured Solirubrobacteraceae bacterium TaxID=1162706 RepID=A0A6J4T4H3_9ACTN|nr:MAG: alpha-methyl-L-serine aldolase [uncultured Solirubrobacteraceae bacterium]
METAPAPEEVRTAPWASPDARARLARVERELPHDPAEALRRAGEAAQAHVRRIEEEALLLYAGGNVPEAAGTAAHARMLSGQPSMGYPGDKYQAGLEHLDLVEVAVARTVADVMGARFAEVRPTSATLANLAVYTALAQPGDTIAVLPDWAGGHLSHHAVGAPGVRGLRVAELPYDAAALDVDLDRLPGMLARERPVLVVVGGSLMLRPHRLEAIAEAVHAHGARLLYDASHVAGLIAEGRFQVPLREGADLLTFSTYKSFGGPAGGVVAGDDEELMARVAAAVYPGLTANYDLARLLPLGAAAVGHGRSAGRYADACTATARALEAALAAQGLPVLGQATGPTRSHHVAVDVRALGGGPGAARRLAAVDLLLSEIGCPAPDGPDPRGAIRIGTQTVTRQGFTEADMPDVARALADGLQATRPAEVLRDEVHALRRRHTGTRSLADGDWG